MSRIETLLSHLGGIRDGVLIGAGALYVAGYLSWALFAMQFGLGFVPALDPQYFTAGIAPVAILALLFLALSLLAKLSAWSRKPRSERQKSIGAGIWNTGIVFICVGAALDWISSMESLSPSFLYSGVALVAVSAFFSPARLDRIYRRLLLGYAYAVVPLVCVALLLAYVRVVFPLLPQELAGPHPRCVELDLDASKLSAKSLTALGHKPIPLSASAVRSKRLWIVFDGSSDLIVKSEPGVLSKEHTPLRIDRSVVSARFPCLSASER